MKYDTLGYKMTYGDDPERDETEEEKQERVEREVKEGQHRQELEEFIVKKTDFISDIVELALKSQCERNLGRLLVSEIEMIISDFAEQHHG